MERLFAVKNITAGIKVELERSVLAGNTIVGIRVQLAK